MNMQTIAKLPIFFALLLCLQVRWCEKMHLAPASVRTQAYSQVPCHHSHLLLILEMEYNKNKIDVNRTNAIK